MALYSYFIKIIIAIIPIMAMIAGLSLGFIIPFALILLLILLGSDMKVNFYECKLELLFLAYIACSIFWAISFKTSFTYYILLAFISIASIVIIQNLSLLQQKLGSWDLLHIIGFTGAILIFILEYNTQGFLNTSFRKSYEIGKNPDFYLHYLDRGCIFLAMFSWVVISHYVQKKQYLAACLIYSALLYLLYISDSLSGFLGFALAGVIIVIFGIVIRNNKWQFYLYATTLFSVITIFLLSSYFIDANKINEQYSDSLSISAKHRVFIWSHVMKEKIPEALYFGHGYQSSRSLGPKPEESIIYNGIILSLLPVHPHNHILQILLEEGIVGCIFYILLILKLLYHITNKNNSYDLWQRAIFYAAFCNFSVISMIAYSMWQPFWLSSYIWCLILLLYKFHDTKTAKVS
jgi:O-antigen ligase